MVAAPAAAAAAAAAALDRLLPMEIDSPSMVRKPGRGFQPFLSKKGGREAAFLLLAMAFFNTRCSVGVQSSSKRMRGAAPMDIGQFWARFP